MDYKKLVENIDKLAKERGISRHKALVESGVGKNFVNNIMREGGSKPGSEKIQQLADYFDVGFDRLLGKTDNSILIKSNISAIIGSENIYQIPVFETVSAGFGAYASNDIIDYIPVVIKNSYDVDNTIAIKVRGDSMYPKIEDGDIVVVHHQTSVDKGDIAVILLDGEEGLVKKVMYGDDWIELHSLNPEYKTKRFEGAEVERLRVVGKVMQVIKTL